MTRRSGRGNVCVLEPVNGCLDPPGVDFVIRVHEREQAASTSRNPLVSEPRDVRVRETNHVGAKAPPDTRAIVFRTIVNDYDLYRARGPVSQDRLETAAQPCGVVTHGNNE
jgi:hypothetical protein